MSEGKAEEAENCSEASIEIEKFTESLLVEEIDVDNDDFPRDSVRAERESGEGAAANSGISRRENFNSKHSLQSNNSSVRTSSPSASGAKYVKSERRQSTVLQRARKTSLQGMDNGNEIRIPRNNNRRSSNVSRGDLEDKVTSLQNTVAQSISSLYKGSLSSIRHRKTSVGGRSEYTFQSSGSIANGIVKVLHDLEADEHRQSLAPIVQVPEEDAKDAAGDAVIRESRLKRIENRACCFLKKLMGNIRMKKAVDPKGSFSKRWTFTYLVSIYISTILLPFQVAFPWNLTGETPLLMGVEYVMDVFCIVNIYIKLNTGVMDEYGRPVSDHQLILQDYKNTTLKYDLWSLAPFEFLSLAIGGVNSVPFFRLNRIVRMYNYVHFFRLQEDDLRMSLGVIRIFKFLVFISLMIMWGSCGWFFLACNYNFFDRDLERLDCSDSWVSRYLADDASRKEQFIMSLYYIVTTATAVGYGDIYPQTDGERIYAGLVMIIGVLTFSLVLASIASTLSNNDAERTRFRQKVNTIVQYLEVQGVPKKLIDQITEFFIHKWKFNRGLEMELYEQLPYSFREEVAIVQNRDKLEEVPLFHNCSIDFLRTLSANLVVASFLPGDTIVEKGDIGSEMFFVRTGCVNVVSDDHSVVYASLEPGKFFGEVALLMDTPRTANVVADTHCDLLILTKSVLDDLLEEYPDIQEIIMQEAAKRMIAMGKEAPPQLNIQTIEPESSQGSSNGLDTSQTLTSQLSADSGCAATLEIERKMSALQVELAELQAQHKNLVSKKKTKSGLLYKNKSTI
eukprot:Nk52_evm60s223 gene=Nk52_evmTU60s223